MKEKVSTQELYNELKSRIQVKLQDNEVPCPECNGLRFIFELENDKGYINSCNHCYNGKNYKCKHCGKLNKLNHCDCIEAKNERKQDRYNKEKEEKEKLFEKAKKIKFKDYEGRFIINEDNFTKDSNYIYEWLYDSIKYKTLTDEELPKFLWGTYSEPVFGIDLDDVIQSECENGGYEDMYSCLDTKSSKLADAQNLIDEWEKEQGTALNVYYENYGVAVLLDDLIEKIKRELKSEGE